MRDAVLPTNSELIPQIKFRIILALLLEQSLTITVEAKCTEKYVQFYFVAYFLIEKDSKDSKF